MQLVYISNRPEILSQTLVHVSRHMEFIDSIMIVCPAVYRTSFNVPDRLSVLIVPEEKLLPATAQTTFAKLDHTSKNYLLRTAMLELQDLDPEFIMSDDDSRPLRTVCLADFKADEKYQGYFFFDLALWNYCRTDFDRGQRVTNVLLQYHGMEHLSYASHMPQIINRDIFREAASFFHEPAKKYPLCEWSIYFNFGRQQYPDRFLPPRPFRTLCWPSHPGTWPYYVRPEAVLFENYYPELYEKNGIFADLPELPAPEEADHVTIEKMVRMADMEAGRMQFQLVSTDPWRKKSLGHRLASITGKQLRKLLSVILIEERSSLLQLRRERE